LLGGEVARRFFSKTDKDALLFKKHKGAAVKLSDMGHLLMENRNGLVVDAR